MRKAVFAIIFSTTFSAAIAGSGSNGPVDGKSAQKIQVLDYSNLESLAGAAIHIRELDKTIYADFDGYVSLEGIPAGDYTLSVQLISYDRIDVADFHVGNNEGLTKLRLKSVSL